MTRGEQALGNWLQDATCEYGENPWRLGWWALACVVLFAALYYLADLYGGAPVTLAQAAGQPVSPFDYLSFSFMSFASMTFDRFQPASSVGAALASAEAMLKLALLSLFMYSLGRRMSGN